MVRVSSLAAMLIVLAGCSTPVTAPAEAPPSREILPAIAKIRMRDVDLTIESSSHGPLFMVAARDGTFVERDLRPDDLASRYPALYQMYRSAVARAPGAPYLDARLDPPAETDRGSGSRSR